MATESDLLKPCPMRGCGGKGQIDSRVVNGYSWQRITCRRCERCD